MFLWKIAVQGLCLGPSVLTAGCEWGHAGLQVDSRQGGVWTPQRWGRVGDFFRCHYFLA